MRRMREFDGCQAPMQSHICHDWLQVHAQPLSSCLAPQHLVRQPIPTRLRGSSAHARSIGDVAQFCLISFVESCQAHCSYAVGVVAALGSCLPWSTTGLRIYNLPWDMFTVTRVMLPVRICYWGRGGAMSPQTSCLRTSETRCNAQRAMPSHDLYI